ncbi:unnamed protein product, partial [Didymodactylos carnosus]
PKHRREIWDIIRLLKEDKENRRTIIFTTHYLDEADLLADRVAIMTNGGLQAYGTTNYLKQQINLEYHLFMDKDVGCEESVVRLHLQSIVPQIIFDRESISEIRYGIGRGQDIEIQQLIESINLQQKQLKIKNYGIATITMEDVFLQLVEEADQTPRTINNDDTSVIPSTTNSKNDLINKVFGGGVGQPTQRQLIVGLPLYLKQFFALINKRFIISRRQYLTTLGFILIPLIIEIIIIVVLPTPGQIQSSILQNDHIKNASVQLIPSIYNTQEQQQTVVIYGNSNNTPLINLRNYLSVNQNINVEQITTDTIMSYVQQRYNQTEMLFMYKYQIAQSFYLNLTATLPLTFDAYFSTVNYHTMAVSLGVSMTQLFQYYSNNSQKEIITTNMPLITTSNSTSTSSSELLQKLMCFDALPQTLFGFLNTVLAVIFTSIFLIQIIKERRTHSKNLQLICNHLSYFIYWLSNFVYEFVWSIIMCTLLTIIVKISAALMSSNLDAEVHLYGDHLPQIILYFFFLILFCTAIIPIIYTFSFIMKTELIGFINYIIINNLASRDGNSSSNQILHLIYGLRLLLSILFPCVNLKRSLYNIRLHDNTDCIKSINSILSEERMGQNVDWFSFTEPGLGIQLLIFLLQILFWCITLIIIEQWSTLKKKWWWYKNKHKIINDEYDYNNLDDDVDTERVKVDSIYKNPLSSVSKTVVLCRNLVKQFNKRKTTTFSMLTGELEQTSGNILICGKDSQNTSDDNDAENAAVKIGYCPQFDWLIESMNVEETLTLFARLHGLKECEIKDLCKNTIKLFGLDTYEDRLVQKLSGGNARKLSSAIAFMSNPQLVFLDEPTTGLDAVSKRKLWTVIRAARNQGITIILTSHSMEECEALCTRIGIVIDGQFRCIGELNYLRNKFSNYFHKGYTVQVNVKDDQQTVMNDLFDRFPNIEMEGR